MNRYPLLRTLLTSGAIAAATALAGCGMDSAPSAQGRHLQHWLAGHVLSPARRLAPRWTSTPLASASICAGVPSKKTAP